MKIDIYKMSTGTMQGCYSLGQTTTARGVPMSDELQKALASIEGYRMTAAEREEQKISFAYGNASKEDTGTKESVRRAIELSEFA